MSTPKRPFLNRLKKKPDAVPPVAAEEAKPAPEVQSVQPEPEAKPKIEKVAMELGDFLQRLPDKLLRKGPHDQKIWFELSAVWESFQRGKPTLLLSEIAKASPELFAEAIRPEEDVEVFFPWQKLRDRLEEQAPRAEPGPTVVDPGTNKPFRNIRFGVQQSKSEEKQGPDETPSLPERLQMVFQKREADVPEPAAPAAVETKLRASLQEAKRESAKISESLVQQREAMLAQIKELRDQLANAQKAGVPAGESSSERKLEEELARALSDKDALAKERDEILKEAEQQRLEYKARFVALKEEKKTLEQSFEETRKRFEESQEALMDSKKALSEANAKIGEGEDSRAALEKAAAESLIYAELRTQLEKLRGDLENAYALLRERDAELVSLRDQERSLEKESDAHEAPMLVSLVPAVEPAPVFFRPPPVSPVLVQPPPLKPR